MNFPKAIDEAVKECIEKGILADFLKKHIAEVRTVLLTEFNEERDYRIVAEGLAENIVEERLEKIEKKAREDEKKTIIKTMLSNGLPIEDIIKFTGISEGELNKIINS